MNNYDFNILLNLLLKKVTVVPSVVLIQHRDAALKIVKDIDVDDALYFACALAFPGSIIWSNDKKLKKQSAIKILNTSEIKNLDESFF